MRRGHNIKVKRDGESSGCSRARMLNVRRLPRTADSLWSMVTARVHEHERKDLA